jgi:KipI family sensor histidine kinase inhibitor
VTFVGDSGLEVVVPAAAAADMVAHVRAVADAVEAAGCPEIVDVVPGIDRVLVVYDPVRSGDPHALRDRLAAAATTEIRQDRRGTRHEIPVCYGGSHGPDLEEVCRLHRIDRDDLVRLHTAPEYLVHTVGFTPGFGYLHGLPESLATPRRRSPRTHVPAGSVGIGGSQTGVYPCATPGGWNIIGRSPTVFFDVSQPHPALLRAGDTVRFAEITAAEFAAACARRTVTTTAHPTTSAATPGILVEEPGLWTTIQDLGRAGQRAAGVPQSGGVDTASLRLANLLVGNPETAAGLEFTLTGPRLLFERDTLVAGTGGEFTGLPRWQPVRIRAGTHVALGQARSGCRGLLAVAGGIAVPRVLGSASTYEPATLGGLGGGRLAAGDRLPLGDAGDAPAAPASIDPTLVAAIAPDPPQPCTLRIIPAVDDGLPCAERLWHQAWRTSARSDRMGVRFEGEPAERTAATATTTARSISRPVLPGTVQLPPDGQPIVLLADAQTMGGYPVIGHVIAADLRLAAQLRPGHPVRWRRVTLAEAHAAARAAETMLASLRRSGVPGGRNGA